MEKNTKNLGSKVLKTKNDKTIFSSKCTICVSGKSRSMKEKEAKGLLGSLGIKTLPINIPLLGNTLF